MKQRLQSRFVKIYTSTRFEVLPLRTWGVDCGGDCKAKRASGPNPTGDEASKEAVGLWTQAAVSAKVTLEELLRRRRETKLAPRIPLFLSLSWIERNKMGEILNFQCSLVTLNGPPTEIYDPLIVRGGSPSPLPSTLLVPERTKCTSSKVNSE